MVSDRRFGGIMIIPGILSSSAKSTPLPPTIGTATDSGSGRAYNNGLASVTFTAPTFDGKLPITGYTVTSSPGGFTGTGSTSPITVSGLQSATAYTFTITATNDLTAANPYYGLYNDGTDFINLFNQNNMLKAQDNSATPNILANNSYSYNNGRVSRITDQNNTPNYITDITYKEY